MNSLDIFLLIFIAYFTIRGIFRGLIKELIIILALILGYYLAMTFYDPLSHWLLKSFKALPKTGAQILAFILIFVIINVLLRLLGSFLEKLVKLVFLQSINRLGGALFGLLKSLFFLSIVVFLVRLIPYSAKFLQKIGAGQSLIWPYVIYFSTFVFKIFAAVIPNINVQQQMNNLIHIAMPDTSIFKLLK